jgi:hypothetical protein
MAASQLAYAQIWDTCDHIRLLPPPLIMGLFHTTTGPSDEHGTPTKGSKVLQILTWKSGG